MTNSRAVPPSPVPGPLGLLLRLLPPPRPLVDVPPPPLLELPPGRPFLLGRRPLRLSPLGRRRRGVGPVAGLVMARGGRSLGPSSPGVACGTRVAGPPAVVAGRGVGVVRVVLVGCRVERRGRRVRFLNARVDAARVFQEGGGSRRGKVSVFEGRACVVRGHPANIRPGNSGEGQRAFPPSPVLGPRPNVVKVLTSVPPLPLV